MHERLVRDYESCHKYITNKKLLQLNIGSAACYILFIFYLFYLTFVYYLFSPLEIQNQFFNRDLAKTAAEKVAHIT